jgi:hypothetical protein
MDEAVSDTEHNTCATSYVTADNSTYGVSYVNERIKTDLSCCITQHSKRQHCHIIWRKIKNDSRNLFA